MFVKLFLILSFHERSEGNEVAKIEIRTWRRSGDAPMKVDVRNVYLRNQPDRPTFEGKKGGKFEFFWVLLFEWPFLGSSWPPES